MPVQPIYQFYAELLDYRPKIWRRFQVLDNIIMAHLGYILMTMFEMRASHLFCLDVPFRENLQAQMREEFPEKSHDNILAFPKMFNDMRFEVMTEDSMDFPPEDGVKQYEASEYKVKKGVSCVGDKMMFTYDYGDNWQISLVLEKCFTDKDLSGKLFPRVLEGEGYGIIEDCGGTGGLEELAKAFKKKKGRAYQEFSEWLGIESLDMQSFDLEDINFRLKKVPRIYKDIYENRLYPTQQSIDLLERKGKHYDRR